MIMLYVKRSKIRAFQLKVIHGILIVKNDNTIMRLGLGVSQTLFGNSQRQPNFIIIDLNSNYIHLFPYLKFLFLVDPYL